MIVKSNKSREYNILPIYKLRYPNIIKPKSYLSPNKIAYFSQSLFENKTYFKPWDYPFGD